MPLRQHYKYRGYMQHKDRLAQLLQALDEMNERIIDIKRFLKTYALTSSRMLLSKQLMNNGKNWLEPLLNTILTWILGRLKCFLRNVSVFNCLKKKRKQSGNHLNQCKAFKRTLIISTNESLVCMRWSTRGSRVA